MFKTLENQLSSFVFKETHGRDETHGHMHMFNVAENAKFIMEDMDLSLNQQKWAIIVAWLHDVADHKYDKNGQLQIQVETFVNAIEPDDNIAQYIIQCINMVSFSNETRNGYKYYENVLPKEWVVVRNIASDADKLEALGLIGIKRCMEYSVNKSKQVSTRAKKISYVWEHAEEKLLLLYKYYINTEAGKKLAKPLHNMMCNWFIYNGISPLLVEKYNY
jgi:uncharacterized protein